jgi:WD40 repeat protein
MIASANKDKNIKVWKVDDGKLIQTFKDRNKLVFLLNFTPDGQTLASASSDKTIKLWRIADGKLYKP